MTHSFSENHCSFYTIKRTKQMKEEDYLRCEISWDPTHREARGSLWMVERGSEKGGREGSVSK